MEKVTVRIANPVKMDGAVYMPGMHEVDPEIADAMVAAGLLAGDEAPAVEAQDAGTAAATATADALAADRDAALARAEAAEARIAEFEAMTRDSAAATLTPAAPAAKAQKKAAATKG